MNAQPIESRERRPRVLVVDDDRVILCTVADALRRADYEVSDAVSAEEALKLIQEQLPDIALLDVSMPGMSGIDLAKHLLQEGEVPFLFLSAFDDRDIVRLAAETGALGYLVKPVSPQQIVASIEGGLARAQEIRVLRQTGSELREIVHSAEHAQQQSEAQLSGIVESAMRAIITVDEDMNVILFNPAAEKIFGYRRADMADAKLDRLIPARFRHAHGKHMNAFGASTTTTRKMSERGIMTGLRANGEEFPVEATISHLTLNGKKQYTVTLADITERLAAEENLRLAAEVIENSPEGIVITDASNRIISVNPAFTSITGFTAEEVIGEHPRILSSGVQGKEFYQAMWASINATGRWQGEIWDRRKNGELYCEWLSISTVKNPRGEIVHHAAIFADITERKRAEEARAQLAAIVENSNDAIIGRALDGTITSWNAAAERLYGYTAAEAIDRDLRMTPPEVEHEITLNRRLLCNGKPVVSYETVRVTKDGRRVDVSRSMSAIKDQSGNIIGMASIVRDITGHKRAEQEILKLNAELEQRVAERTRQLEAANKELEAFSYSVSHDLRTPLRGIDGFSQMLLKKYAGQLDETGSDYLQRIRNASTRMGELIEDMLQLSRISASKLETERVDLSQLARSILAELRRGEPERKVEIEVQDGMVISADPRLLRIALENLLGNAWKFTGKKEVAIIRVGSEQQDGDQVIFVKDNGAGFDMKYAHKLFGAFQRLHSTAEFEGTGIGLATVQRILNLHGGRIWADSAPDEGTSFYFVIPPAGDSETTTM